MVSQLSWEDDVIWDATAVKEEVGYLILSIVFKSCYLVVLMLFLMSPVSRCGKKTNQNGCLLVERSPAMKEIMGLHDIITTIINIDYLGTFT